MRALRTLAHPCQARTQAVAPTKLLSVKTCPHDTPGHFCHAGEPTFLSRFLSVNASSDATCRQDVDHFVMQPTSAYHVSRFDTCGLDAKLPFSHANSQACKHHMKVSESHIHTCASEGTSLNGDVSVSIQGPRKPSGLSQPNARRQDSVHHACNAIDSTFTPALEGMGKRSEAVHPPIRSQASQIRARCKAQEKSQSLELLHRKISLLECEKISLRDATSLRKSVAFKSASLENLVAVLKVLKEFLGSGEKACKALTLNPGITLQRSDLLGQMLTVLANFGIREVFVRKLCTVRNVLPRRLETTRRTLSFLEEIGLTVKARNRVFGAHPKIIRASKVPMLHALDFFTSLGMNGEEIRLSLQKQPAILLCSVGHLRRRCIFFRQLGCTVDEFLNATRAGLPLIAIRTFQAKIKFLKDRGFSDRDVHVSIIRHPIIFGLALEALKSKLDFLLTEQNYDIADIVRYPSILAFSLQERLIPRLKAVKEKGLFKVYALSTVLTCNDLYFQKLGSRAKRPWTRRCQRVDLSL